MNPVKTLTRAFALTILVLFGLAVQAEIVTHWTLDGNVLDWSGNSGDLVLPNGGTFNAGGQFDCRESFVDQLPREVNVRAVFEHDNYLRQPELGNRTQLFQSR